MPSSIAGDTSPTDSLRAGSAGRFGEIESLRAVLALWVLFAHCMGVTGYEPQNLHGVLRVVRMAGYAVDAFVIISGFVISLLIFGSRERYPVFLMRRWFRLFPLYAVCMLTGAFLYPLEVANLHSASRWLTESRFQGELGLLNQFHGNPVPYALACLPMLQGVIPERLLPGCPSAFLGTAWSISLEWQFYLVAPILVPMMLHVGGAKRALLAWAAVVFAFLLAKAGCLPQVALGAFLPYHIEFFALGILSYGICSHFPEGVAKRHPLLSISLVLALFLLPLAKGNYGLLPWLVWMVLVFHLIQDRKGHADAATRMVKYVFANKPMVFLGQISYGIYLVHLLAIIVCQSALFRYFPMLDKRTHCVSLASSVFVLTIIASAVLHFTVEKPAIGLAKKLSRRLK